MQGCSSSSVHIDIELFEEVGVRVTGLALELNLVPAFLIAENRNHIAIRQSSEDVVVIFVNFRIRTDIDIIGDYSSRVAFTMSSAFVCLSYIDRVSGSDSFRILIVLINRFIVFLSARCVS